MTIDKTRISEGYYKSSIGPVAETVGDLKLLLDQLPDDLAIDADSQVLMVYNIKTDNPVLTFEEVE